MLKLNSLNVWPKCRFVTMFDYSQGEANRFPGRMFQTINQLGAKLQIVSYFKPDWKVHYWRELVLDQYSDEIMIHTCMWCIGPISITNISLYIFPFPSMILYKHLHWNKQKTIRYNQGWNHSNSINKCK